MKLGIKTEEKKEPEIKLEDGELSFLQSLLMRPNVKIGADKSAIKEYIGRHVYVLHSDDRAQNKQYYRGDIFCIRDANTFSYSCDSNFKVGPLGSLNPGDFSISIPIQDVFVLPRTITELTEEFNRLVAATEQLAARIDYMTVTDKTQFDEKLYLADRTLSELYEMWGQPDISGENNIAEKESKIKVFLRKAIKV